MESTLLFALLSCTIATVVLPECCRHYRYAKFTFLEVVCDVQRLLNLSESTPLINRVGLVVFRFYNLSPARQTGP